MPLTDWFRREVEARSDAGGAVAEARASITRELEEAMWLDPVRASYLEMRGLDDAGAVGSPRPFRIEPRISGPGTTAAPASRPAQIADRMIGERIAQSLREGVHIGVDWAQLPPVVWDAGVRVPRPAAATASLEGVEYDLDPVNLRMVPRTGGPALGIHEFQRRGLRRPSPPREPSTIDLGAGEAVDAEYAALAGELGIAAGALERFRALVQARGIRVYDRAEVQEYLHTKYEVPRGNVTATVVWGWRPLREDDCVADESLSGANGVVQRGTHPYRKPIPFPVLLTVKAIVDELPTAHFFVSDEMQAEAIPDPFLLVEIAGDAFVVERWDEPAFRPKR